ncbi:hypothetical protein HYW55_01135 [Candidatus Gottesmanbacteria bacterium]|nr:hypothetical protein [Candidatus Gottesmanbacteria bacterium]
MLKVSDIISDILQHDEIAFVAFDRGLLNYSQYAKSIRSIVEEKTKKKVELGTIVVALSRLREKLQKFPVFRPKVRILEYSIKSPLFEMTFEKTSESIDTVSWFLQEYGRKGLFSETSGVGEITLLCDDAFRKRAEEHMKIKPTVILENLASVTVRFSDEYLEVPNTIYTLVSALAVYHINVIEIVSTFTELSFIVRKGDIEKTIHALSTSPELLNM